MIKFFVKPSRPSKEEKALAEKIQIILAQAEQDGNKEILSAVESHGAVYNLDGLKKIYNIVSGEKNNSNPNNTTMGKTNNNHEEEERFSSPINNHEAEEVEFEETINQQTESPLQQPVIERQDELEKFKQEHGIGGERGGGNDSEGGDNEGGDGEFEESRESGDSAGDDNGAGEDFTASGGTGNLKDVPPDTKRKAIKKTSEIVAKIYAGVLPILPKMISKIPEAKLERMSWNDEIDLGMKLELPDGSITNVGSYIRQYNQNLENELTITPDQQKDFQDCLKDVLEEKQVAMTPMQRLTATVCAQLFTLVSVGAQNTIMMKKNLDYWKEVHEENKRRTRPQKPNPPSSGNGGGNNPPPPPATSKPPVDKTPSSPTNPSSANKESEEENHHDDIQEENEELTIAPETAEEKQ